MQLQSVDVGQVIDQAPVSGLQRLVILICAVVALLDGFDAQSIAFVAPAITHEWGLEVGSFGPIFAVGLLGLAIGALTIGSWADRIGRKRTIVISTACFGIFSLATAMVSNVPELAIGRFLTGLGLGGAMPNIIALSAEYMPKRIRATSVTIMFCGFPLGAVFGGLASAKLIALFGWKAVFVAGGILPLLLIPVQLFVLPESISYLASRGDVGGRIKRILGRIQPVNDFADSTRYILSEDRLAGVPVKHLFSERRTLSTLSLWILFFCNLLMLFFLFNWLPTVLTQSGLSLEKAIIGTVVLNAGGIIGALLLSRVVDRRGPYGALFLSNCLAAVFIVGLGAPTLSLPLLLTIVFLAGFFVIGTQFCIMSHTAGFYPTSIRATGLGWALGVGRVGSIVGPLIGGFLMSANWSPASLFQCAAVPAIVSAFAIIVLGHENRRKVTLFTNSSVPEKKWA